jgi:NADH dehydrogenase/NADH:ubiquinone oxidoreductase subunit G
MSLQISIDGRSLSVEKGKTLLQVARENGIDIPTLCDFPGLTSHGSCRMCVVEIAGRPNTPTACTTLAEEGMVVQTNSPKVQALRIELLKLLLSEHPSSCLFCPEKSHCDDCMVTLRKSGVTTGCRSCPDDGQCELQTLVDRFGLSEVGYPVRYRMLPVLKNDPFFDRDYNLCVLCERCVRVCEEDHFSSVLTLTSRGTDACRHRVWALHRPAAALRRLPGGLPVEPCRKRLANGMENRSAKFPRPARCAAPGARSICW